MNETLYYRDKSFRTDLYIAEELEQPLLSRDASKQLGIVHCLNQVDSLRSSTVDPKREYPKLFTGLGHVKIPYTIKLRPDAEPLVLMTPRRVAIPLLDKTKTKLGDI